MKPNQKGKRTCLRCDKLFISDGAYHRICSHCATLGKYRYTDKNEKYTIDYENGIPVNYTFMETKDV